MAVSSTLPFPFYTGGLTELSADVPGKYSIGLAGRGYNLDLKSNQFAHVSIPILKPQQDSSGQVNESSLNPEGLWRRSQDSWHEGAGQTYLDKPDSSSNRFRSSIGIDPWTKGELTLLSDTFKKLNITGGAIGENVRIITAGDFLYLAYDSILVYLTDPLNDISAGTVVDVGIMNGEANVDVQSLASDGNYIYAALGFNGIHRTARGMATSEHFSDLEANLVGYTLGRLMAAKGAAIYNIIAAGAAPVPLYTHPNPDFTWVGFAEGKGHIFSAGFSGDKSIIYKTAIKPDGTELEIPSSAGQLPDGEVVRSIYGYLGFIMIGTDNGVRFAVPDTNGNLEIGALIETDSPVFCFEGQGEFIWFGWTNYDSGHTGLGRCDLRTIVNNVAPAYASDLMAVDQGTVNSIVTFQGRRFFSVARSGVYLEASFKVASGTIDSGLISYGIPESKIAVYLDVRYLSLDGSDQIWLARSDGVFQLLGTNTSLTQVNQFSAQGLSSEFFEIRHVLLRDSTDTTQAPIITRHTLKSQPTANMGEYIILPILLSSDEKVGSTSQYRDIVEELAFLKGLRRDRQIVPYQEGITTYNVSVEDYEFHPSHLNNLHPPTGYQGTMIMKLKEVV